MNLKNKPPVFVPRKYWKELETLSKAALMDMVWDYANQIGGPTEEETLEEFRKRRYLILLYRKQGFPGDEPSADDYADRAEWRAHL
jgi:hypothetical protein